MSKVTSQPNLRPAARAWPRTAGTAALALLALAALPLLGRALMRLWALLRYPYPHDGLEGTLLHEARLLWSGQPLYQSLTRFDFISAPYPPLHPLLLGLADQIAGPHVFWGGRLLSLAATIGIALLIALIIRHAGRSWLAGLIGVALFLSAPPVLLWATRVKPDLFSLLWTTAGLYLALRLLSADSAAPPARAGRAWLGWLLVAVCFVLAFFSKQTDVAAPLACGLALLIGDLRAFYGANERDGMVGKLPVRWRTLGFTLAYFVLALGVWALLDLVTHGQYTAHVWGLHRSEWWDVGLLLKFVALLMPYWPALLLAALLLARALRTGRALLPACYALVMPITLLGAGETGANHNHLLESMLALAITTGIAAAWAADLLRQPRVRAWWALPLLLLALLAGQTALAYQPQQWYVGELAPSDPPQRYIDYIRDSPGEVLADDVGLLFAAGRPLRYDDPSTMGPAARSGVWDQSGLVEEITAQRFSAILLPINVEHETTDAAGRWNPEVLSAVRAHYQLAFRDTIFIYTPKQ